ncbi:cbb3-type cytochrome oxidase subunit 3 [Dysgonomonas sp. PFB1-18]|nr:cbb3-type cytochrome oxidase subunit 3 [Dysgonomonas sp. PF1-14]MDH6337626.1 cbb3-type cytochrome oxidase subunit 3 [Dysgonomonas sp. PF1-16]MDH6378850.1 cbb3-type cytochrome oxidase subunit 3 [Dysgonomonas sp. PFB1-18]MDH6396485.1 cbb3-type cytochrome oxidase subunit 3 [Dysgonomonas sp. PF1-23]
MKKYANKIFTAMIVIVLICIVAIIYKVLDILMTMS